MTSVPDNAIPDKPKVVIMAGGTGGHIFPALAVADQLKRLGATVSWLGTRHGMEAEVVAAAGYPIDFIAISGLRGKGLVGWLSAPFRVMRAVLQAHKVLRQRNADVVLGMGGFVTGPGGIAAWLSGRPLLIHEQNAIPGLTNRLLARFTQQVMEAYPGSFDASLQVEHVGNPLRRSIITLSPPKQRYADRRGPIRLLVVGGSLGASALNAIVPLALARLTDTTLPLVRHQCGASNQAVTSAGYAQAGVVAEVVPFIEDMAKAYGWADLVICRAGALTVSELAGAGVASLLVPYPFAVDDHQTANARFLTEAGAARLLPQAELTAETLAAELSGFCLDAEAGRMELAEMATKARQLAIIDATERVCQHCLEAAQMSSRETR